MKLSEGYGGETNLLCFLSYDYLLIILCLLEDKQSSSVGKSLLDAVVVSSELTIGGPGVSHG